MLNVKGRDVSDEEEMELLKGEQVFFFTQIAIFDVEKGDRNL